VLALALGDDGAAQHPELLSLLDAGRALLAASVHLPPDRAAS